MKECPRCRKNLVDSAAICTFCQQPLPVSPATAPAFAAPPSYGTRPLPLRAPLPRRSSFGAAPPRAPSLAPRPSALDGDGERPTLNPFVLFGRCFRLSGAFSRAQFAIVYLGAIAAFWGFAILTSFALALLGAAEDVTLRATTFALTAMVPVVLVAAFGGSIRRWHDLGKPGWYALLWIVPCVNGVTVLYLLLAPGERERDGRSGSMPGWLVAAVAFVVAVFGVGLVAAIAIPSLLRARVSANEAAAIGDVRTVISAEAAYQRVNGGLYEGRLTCLASPVSCVPGYPANGSGFVDAALAAVGARHGYEGRLEAASPAGTVPARSSPTSVVTFAYVLRPVQPGQTGVRSFCGDSTGVICFRSDGADIPAAGGACPRAADACRPLQ
jgi:type IV pilus assembly protein PilA